MGDSSPRIVWSVHWIVDSEARPLFVEPPEGDHGVFERYTPFSNGSGVDRAPSDFGEGIPRDFGGKGTRQANGQIGQDDAAVLGLRGWGILCRHFAAIESDVKFRRVRHEIDV